MEADSAVWYLEGLLNYEQANNSHEFQKVKFLYDTLQWPASNGSISFQDLQQLYVSVNELAQHMAQQNENSEFTFNVIDLQLDETGFKNGEQAVVVTLSGGLLATIPTYLPFDLTDYWRSGDLLGKCDEFTGQHIGRDATTELENRFKIPYTQPGYFVSIASRYITCLDNLANDNPYGYFMLWYENINHSNHCLSPGELNYYLGKWEYLKNKYKPEGLTFCSADVIFDIIMSTDPRRCHSYDVKYGVFIGSNPN